MISTCSGPRRIELDEETRTIEDFLDFATAGTPTFAYRGDQFMFDDTVNLIAFLRKYDCQGTLQHLRYFMGLPEKDEDMYYVHMLAAMHMGMPDMVAELIRDRPELFAWLRPERGNKRRNHLEYDIFKHIPNRYLWALMAAGVDVDNGEHQWTGRDRRRQAKVAAERFLWYYDPE